MYGKKHLDQIQSSLGKQPVLEHNEELPGNGMFYCVECDRFFQGKGVLDEHARTKKHKKRVKELKQVLHTTRDAEEAAGLVTK